MIYADLTDIEALFEGVDFRSENSTISEASINYILSMNSRYIDTRLRIYYDLPLSDADDLFILKTICSYLTAGQIEGILNPRLASSLSKKETPLRNLEQKGESMLDNIINGTMILKANANNCLIAYDFGS